MSANIFIIYSFI